MTKKIINCNMYQPFWPSSLHTLGYTATIGAGVTFQTAVPYPLAAIGEKYLKFDCNDATSHLLYDVASAEQSVTGESISGAFRWGECTQQVMQFGTTLPSSAALILDTSALPALFGHHVVWNTDGTISVIDSEHNSVVLGTSVLTLPTATDILLEYWRIPYNAAGVLMGVDQIVVRYGTISAGNPPSYTTLINTYGAHSSLSLGAGSLGYGETTQRGAGVVFYLGKVVTSIQNADDPYGILRVDRMDPDGVGHLNELSGVATTIDESGTAVPDDTDFNSKFGTNQTLREFYTLGAGQTGASDTILRVKVIERHTANISKSFAATDYVGISDATNDVYSGSLIINTSFAQVYAMFSLNAAGSAWAQTDMAGLQSGVKFVYSASGTCKISVVTTTVAYEKSGETGTAVPAGVPSPKHNFEVFQALNRAGSF